MVRQNPEGYLNNPRNLPYMIKKSGSPEVEKIISLLLPDFPAFGLPDFIKISLFGLLLARFRIK